jgi:hypothetical protein
VPVGTQNGLKRIVNSSEKGLDLFSIFTKSFFSFIIKCNCCGKILFLLSKHEWVAMINSALMTENVKLALFIKGIVPRDSYGVFFPSVQELWIQLGCRKL